MTLEDALDRALEEQSLDASFRDEVLEMLHTPRSAWRPCCGMLCDPCVLALHRAVERVRQLHPDLPEPT